MTTITTPTYLTPTTNAPAPIMQAILVTDFVRSTKLTEELGDIRSAQLWIRIDRVMRDLLVAKSGREIDKTDGFLILFDRALDAVRYCLSVHEAIEHMAMEEGISPERLRCRAGIHVAEVILRRNSDADIAIGAKVWEIEGLAKPQTARLMSLAQGGQTLLSRTAFDLARRAAVGDANLPSELLWLAHGRYMLAGIEDPQEIFEAGAPGKAPLVPPPDTDKARRVLAPGEEAVLGWRPAPGQAVPGRPNFTLVDKLGEGGFGEVWLARHAKTNDPRVFKFCFQAERLRGLKREVTLFRLLKEALGEREDIARVLDWRFDEAPYYLELEYTHGGNLLQWAEQKGGIWNVPLEIRLKLVAQIANALAAAHGVGVLHKDVKPSNILIVEGPDRQPRARLTDFGIGLITDYELLAMHGITNTGLTESISAMAPESSRTGTRLYMAPELLEGKPATTLSDIYAVGVILYQMVSANLTTALAPGWERKVPDPLLRQDIADCVDGEAAYRLQRAELLAQRINNLNERRERAHSQQEAERVKNIGVLPAVIVEQSANRFWWVTRAGMIVLPVVALLGFGTVRKSLQQNGVLTLLLGILFLLVCWLAFRSGQKPTSRPNKRAIMTLQAFAPILATVMMVGFGGVRKAMQEGSWVMFILFAIYVFLCWRMYREQR
ncbi:MAG: protein kinase domain-containing protein [Candidatus Sumerlaeaceae bacterium]